MIRISLVLLALLVSGASPRGEQVLYPPGYGVLLRAEQVGREEVIYTPEDDGVTPPKPIPPLVHAQYPPEAFRRKIEGRVTVKVVVREDGTIDPDSVNVTRSVDPVYGLDDAVVKAVKQWRFRPGMNDGQLVSVRVSIDCWFSTD